MRAERILFIQTAFLGDAILVLPTIQKLKEDNPVWLIDILCIPETEELFKASSSISSAIVIDKKGKHKSFLKTLNLIKHLKQNNYTRVYSSHRSLRTALIILLLEVNESYGFDNASLKHVYKNLMPYRINKHEVQRNFDLIGYNYDEHSWKIFPIITPGSLIEDKIKNFLISNNLTERIVVIAPGSVWNTKKYPLEYFEVILKHFVANKFNVVLIGSLKDVEDCARLSSEFGSNVVDVSGKFSVVESIELLKNVELLISNDSASTHMGMCADTRVLTIYCSTVSGFGFYPYNNKSAFVSFDDLQCKPCGIHGHESCPIKTFDCGVKLLPEIIIKKAEEILSD